MTDWRLVALWLFIGVLWPGPGRAEDANRLYALVLGGEPGSFALRAASLLDGSMYAIPQMDVYTVLDAAWNPVDASLYLLLKTPETRSISVFKLPAEGEAMVPVLDLPDMRVEALAIDPRGRYMLLSIITPGKGDIDDGVGFLTYDLLEGRLSGTPVELSINGKTNQLLYLSDMLWSHDGKYVALETSRQPEEAKLSLLPADCVLANVGICEAEIIFSQSPYDHRSPGWSPYDTQIAFLCYEADICFWDRESETVTYLYLRDRRPRYALYWYPEGYLIALTTQKPDHDESGLMVFDLGIYDVIAEFDFSADEVYPDTPIFTLVPESFVQRWGTRLTETD